MSSGMTDAVIFAILTTGAVLIAVQLARLVRAAMQHKTIREAISRDNQSVTALLAAVDQEKEQPTGANDDRTAIVLIALGAALFLYSVVASDAEGIRNVGSAAIFPIFVGGALLLRHWLARRRDRRD